MKRNESKVEFKVDADTILFVMRLLQEFSVRVAPGDLCEDIGLAEGNHSEWCDRWHSKGLFGAFSVFGHMDNGNRQALAELVASEYQCSKDYQRNRA